MKTRNPKQQACIHVGILEADPLRIAGFRALMGGQDDLDLQSLSLGEIGRASEFQVMIVARRNSQALSGILQQLRLANPNLGVIVTGQGGDDENMLEALSIGAKGYVDEAAVASEFVNAIRIVSEGLIWAPRRVLAKFVDRSTGYGGRISGRVDFTSREQEVLEMLVAGRSNKEIAIPLGIEVRTVKAHVAKLMRKVGVQNRIMLSVHAVNHCLVAPR